MFTGIITGLGRIVEAQPLGSAAEHGKRLAIVAPDGYLDDVQAGDSIALNGACMTVTALDPAAQRFHVDVSAESLARTAALGELGPVNLEKALRAHDRLGGHLVTGHVDGIGRVVYVEPVGESTEMRDPCAGRPGALPGLQGLDHDRRRQPDGQPRRRRPGRLRVQRQPDPAHAASTPRSAPSSPAAGSTSRST